MERRGHIGSALQASSHSFGLPEGGFYEDWPTKGATRRGLARQRDFKHRRLSVSVQHRSEPARLPASSGKEGTGRAAQEQGRLCIFWHTGRVAINCVYNQGKATCLWATQGERDRRKMISACEIGTGEPCGVSRALCERREVSPKNGVGDKASSPRLRDCLAA